MKRGGQVIYAGQLGTKSCKLIDYFEVSVKSFDPFPDLLFCLIIWLIMEIILQSVEGVQKIKPGYNPAAWMLEATSVTEEARLGVDFAEIYKKSRLFQ